MVEPLDQFNFHHILAETPGASLVYFTAPACGACKRLKQLFTRQPEYFSDLNLFEVDAVNETALVNEFEVFHLPSMFLFNNGEFHAQIHSEALLEALNSAVQAALKLPAAEAP